jgi:hypothetical protein
MNNTNIGDNLDLVIDYGKPYANKYVDYPTMKMLVVNE